MWGLVLYLNPVAVFWILSVSLCFNCGYVLYLCSVDSKSRKPYAFIVSTALIGTLFVVGTYAHNLSISGDQFALNDCLYLALVVAHGWTAEKVVEGFMKVRSKAGPILKDAAQKLLSSQARPPDSKKR